MFGNVFIAAIILVGVSVVQVGAQIPAVCANNANLQARECCPTTPSGVCGGSRGSCVSVSTLCKTDYDSPMLSSSEDPNRYFTEDGRFNWPSQIFERVCQCHGNYGGYDCQECKFGYGGNNCNNKLRNRVRRSIADLDWSAYREQLRKAKHEPYSRYKVYIGGNRQDESNYVSVSLYDTFAWIHHYVSRTQKNKYASDGSGKDMISEIIIINILMKENFAFLSLTALDYAHESVGFLTWHRLYLLWFEREMQHVLNNAQFTLHYWDWTTQEDRNVPFRADRLGIRTSSSDDTVTGTLMDDWHSVCKGDKTEDTSVCDPKNHKSDRITRCSNMDQCKPSDAGWPNSQDARRCLMFDQFRRDTTDNDISNKYDRASFSNYLEGFAIDDANKVMSDDDIPKSLHNQVSLIQ